jgi:hypothetical protein
MRSARLCGVALLLAACVAAARAEGAPLAGAGGRAGGTAASPNCSQLSLVADAVSTLRARVPGARATLRPPPSHRAAPRRTTLRPRAGGAPDCRAGCVLDSDPVCGANRVTYMNPCLAACGGTEAVHPGPCAPPGGEGGVGVATGGARAVGAEGHPIAGAALAQGPGGCVRGRPGAGAPATASGHPALASRPCSPCQERATTNAAPLPLPPRAQGLFAQPSDVSDAVEASAAGGRVASSADLVRFASEGYTLAGVAPTVDASRVAAEKPEGADAAAAGKRGGE